MRSARSVLFWTAIATAAVALLMGCGRAPAPPEGARVLRPGESIQEAIDAAPAEAVIYLSAGTWEEHVVIDRPVTLRGESRTTTILKGTEYGRSVVRVVDAGPVVLEDLKLSGAAGGHVGYEDPGAGLAVSGAAQVHVRAVGLAENITAGMLVRDQAEVRVQDSYLARNFRFGLVIQGQARVELDGTTIEENGSGGVWVSAGGVVVAHGGRVAHNSEFGIRLRTQGSAELQDVRIEANAGPGLHVENAAQARLVGCRITGNQDPGALLTDTARVELRDTSVEGNWHGLQLGGEASALIEGCSILESRWDGIRLTEAADLEMHDSVLRGGRLGVSMRGQARAALEENAIEDFSIAAIWSSGAAPTGRENRMIGNGIDVLGNVPSGFRAPLREPTRSEAAFPHDDFPSLQHAVDALLPGGVLTLLPGDHKASVTIDSKIEMVGGAAVRLVAASPGAPVLSLIGGADVGMREVHLIGTDEGVVAGADARAQLEACVIRGGNTGLILWDDVELVLEACELVGHSSAGLWLSGSARAAVEASSIRENKDVGLAVGNTASLVLSGSEVTDNGRHAAWGGVMLRDHARAELVGNVFARNRGYGVATYGYPCIGMRGQYFGEVVGGGNVFEESVIGDVCPPELQPVLAAPEA